jgi:hypothetical protein
MQERIEKQSVWSDGGDNVQEDEEIKMTGQVVGPDGRRKSDLHQIELDEMERRKKENSQDQK